MLNRIVQFSLRHRGVVIALGAIVIAYGLYVATRTRLDVFPEFAPPQVVVQTEAPGLSSEEVEQLVTLPVETELNGTPGLEAIRSQSIQGLSVVTLVFHANTDIFRDRQMVAERLSEAVSRLPQGAGPPRMGPLTSSTSLTLVMGLTSTNRTPMELRTFADWTFRPYLLSVPGVAKVDIFGGDIRQLQVQVKPDRLQAYGLSLDEVLAAARQATGVRGAGYVDTPNQRIVINTTGQSLTPATTRRGGPGGPRGAERPAQGRRRREGSAGAQVRRCANQWPVGRGAAGLRPVPGQHDGRHPRAGGRVAADETGAGRRENYSGRAPVPPRQLH